MSEQDKLIPFGKYKGQPVEAMAEDKQYTDWVVAQPWFRERYGNLYAVIINNFCEPSETPEHNALQARFLDDEFRLKFASVASPRLWWYARMNGEMVEKAVAWAVSKIGSAEKIDQLKVVAGTFYREFDQRRYQAIKTPQLIQQSKVMFEEEGIDASWAVYAGIDVVFEKSKYENELSSAYSIAGILNIEIKPEVGDDYPAILRQMRRNKSRHLFTRAYTGVGVDQPTFIQFMDSQGIRVIFEHEVDQQPLIRVDNFDAKQFLERVRTAIELNEI